MRKLISIMLVLLLVLGSCGAVFAGNQTINDSTVITKDNVQAVIEYLGLDPTDFKPNSTSCANVLVTVGELKKALIEQKSKPKNIIETVAVTQSTASNTLAAAVSGAKMLYRTCYGKDSGASYDLTYSVSANFSGKKFTGVSTPNVSVSSTCSTTPCKIASSPSLTATYTSTRVTLTAKFTVITYYVVSGIGQLELNRQKVSSTNYWNASDCL